MKIIDRSKIIDNAEMSLLAVLAEATVFGGGGTRQTEFYDSIKDRLGHSAQLVAQRIMSQGADRPPSEDPAIAILAEQILEWARHQPAAT